MRFGYPASMKFTILTLFPEIVAPYLEQSIIGRAINNGAIEVDVRNLRDWATSDAHRSVDDSPYGGGPGMVLRVDVIDRAVHDLKSNVKSQMSKVVLLTPQGERFTQETAEELAADQNELILIAGHYEGFDERVRLLVDQQISIGDFVLTGGELPALVLVDAVARLLPDVLGADTSAHEESHSIKDESGQRLFEYPQYTRPDTYVPISQDLGELTVPDELKSGHHAAIKAWRVQQARERTRQKMTNHELTNDDSISND